MKIETDSEENRACNRCDTTTSNHTCHCRDGDGDVDTGTNRTENPQGEKPDPLLPTADMKDKGRKQKEKEKETRSSPTVRLQLSEIYTTRSGPKWMDGLELLKADLHPPFKEKMKVSARELPPFYRRLTEPIANQMLDLADNDKITKASLGQWWPWNFSKYGKDRCPDYGCLENESGTRVVMTYTSSGRLMTGSGSDGFMTAGMLPVEPGMEQMEMEVDGGVRDLKRQIRQMKRVHRLEVEDLEERLGDSEVLLERGRKRICRLREQVEGKESECKI